MNRILSRTLCRLGRHSLAPYRRLTEHSAEWRCQRAECNVRFVNYHEPNGPWPFWGKHPYGGQEGLGESLAFLGSIEDVDQRPLLPFRDLDCTESTIVVLMDRLSVSNHSAARLPLLVYLVDWKLALIAGRTMTNIAWTARHAGPASSPVMDVVHQLERSKSAITPRTLDDEEQAAVEHVLEVAAPLAYTDLLLLAMSTRPLLGSHFGDPLDLVTAAAAQNNLMRQAA